VRYHFIREVLEAKTVEVLKVGTEHNAVNALTKVVPGHKLQHCLELLSVGSLLESFSRRGVLLDSHLCPLCNAAMEDVQHVFFRCDVAWVVLRKICRLWDLDWQKICSFSDWDAWFLSFRLSSRLKSILEGVFYVAWWRIWRLRNQLVFDASPPNRSTVFDNIVDDVRGNLRAMVGYLEVATAYWRMVEVGHPVVVKKDYL
ncbi:hypothetical protein Tco_0976250, partial [Tanacetum coccineum]